MMPVAPTAKRANGFSIDSLMSKDRTASPRSPTTSSAVSRSTPPASSSVPCPRPPTLSPEAAGSPRELRDTRGDTGSHSGTPSHPHSRLQPREGRDGLREHTIGGLGSSFHPVHPSSALLTGLKNLHGGTAGMGHHPDYPEGLAALGLAPAALQAGAAAAVAHLPHGLATFPGGLPGHHHGLPHHPVFLGAAQRDPLTLYPWLLSRHGSYFGHPRLGGPEANFLFQPFRKPKRIRTAFSPSQLLRLEHAFEKNHYVVGQERKDLAVTLSLTETQVKVWFQNRRTKYKRMKAEESEGKEGGDKAGSSASGSEHMAEESSDVGSHNGDVSPHPLDCSYREIDIVDDDDEGDIEIDDDDDVTPPSMTSLGRTLQQNNDCRSTSPKPHVPTSHIDRWLQQQPSNHV